MTTAHDALKAWKQIARFAESMAALVPWLEEQASIEQATIEARQRVDKMHAEQQMVAAAMATVKAELTVLMDNKKATENAIVDIRRSAERNADHLIGAAKETAHEIETKALGDAHIMITNAVKDVDAIQAEAKSRAAEIETKIDGRLAHLASIEKAAAEAKVALVNAENARQRVLKALGV